MAIQLSAEQKANVDAIIKAAQEAGITNQLVIAGILAVAAKESAFKLVEEKSYRNTSVARIRSIFTTRVKNFTDAQLEQLKKDDVKFFGVVYGGMGGNNTQGDGFRYRGRGFNQITFKNNYILAAKDTGVSLNLTPERLLNRDVAARALIGFYLRNYPVAVRSGKYPIKTDINTVPRSDTAYNLAYNINRGRHVLPVQDSTGGYVKGKNIYSDVLEYVKKKMANGMEFTPYILIIAGLAGFAWLITRKK
jgi:putative chitinase